MYYPAWSAHYTTDSTPIMYTRLYSVIINNFKIGNMAHPTHENTVDSKHARDSRDCQIANWRLAVQHICVTRCCYCVVVVFVVGLRRLVFNQPRHDAPLYST